MKIIFVENRFKTFFWKKCHEKFLELDSSLQINWIVQNHSFSLGEDDFCIEYPKKRDMNAEKNDFFRDLMKKDRAVYLYGGSASHYSYYYNAIKKYIVSQKPDFVIGESTLFHELIIIDICRNLSIPYLHPTSTRYPLGKFSLFLYDTQVPFEGKNGKFTEEDKEIIDHIVNRKIVPGYMIPSHGLSSLKQKCYKMLNTFISFKSWIFGERYNTPSPLVKLRFNRILSRNIKAFGVLANQTEINDTDYANGILFPLQMQPEANLDVWGAPFNNQLDNLKKLVLVLKENQKVLIKANPKSKYELSDEFLRYIQNSDQILCIGLDVSMQQIFKKVSRIYTVTGTVGIEAVLTGKLLITEPGSPYDGYPNTFVIRGGILYKTPTKYEKERLVTCPRLNSFFGEISDPVYSSSCMSDDNIGKVCTQILTKLRDSL